ncbi:MAG TPA: hypothetical protein VEW28_08525 [Candidatus Kapabacteria bacterium]|nr:hypothetical protein [Candidatus Kapabacteria bacterium]
MILPKLLLSLIISVSIYSFFPQGDDLNLGFERVGYKAKPIGWYAGGGGGKKDDLDGYLGECDSTTVHSGKYSLHLKYLKGDGFGVGTKTLDIAPLRGKTIRFSGWIKTHNVGGKKDHNFDGYAGLWWRVDGPDHKTLAFNNMQDSLVNGTRDWQRYSFELPVGETATNIDFGVQMAGKGEAWFDDLSIDTNGVHYLGWK